LHLDHLEAVQRNVAQLLEHGLNPPTIQNDNAPLPVAEQPVETSTQS
jgi:hypothetical protein